MNLVLQKPGSSNCGQCCVAMIAGLTRKQSCKKFGTKGVTTTKSVSRVLKKLGYVVNERLVSFRKESSLPDTCMLRLRFPKEVQRTGHWVVYHNGLIYCPSLGIYSYTELSTRDGVKCTSYLGFTAK
ncbi:MAG: hypothetical protein ACRYFZ_19410 [Janthinobacterium lividum]